MAKFPLTRPNVKTGSRPHPQTAPDRTAQAALGAEGAEAKLRAAGFATGLRRNAPGRGGGGLFVSRKGPFGCWLSCPVVLVFFCFFCFFPPTVESFGVSAQIGSGVVRGGREVRFHEGCTRVLPGFHKVLPGLPGRASIKQSTACCWGYHLSLFSFMRGVEGLFRCRVVG